MDHSEDYLDGLLDSITQARTEGSSGRRGDRERTRSERSRRRGRIGADDDFLEATGLDSYRREERSRRGRRRSTEDDFLRSFEDELSMDDADDLIRSFERELAGGGGDDADFDIVDHEGRDSGRRGVGLFTDGSTDGGTSEAQEKEPADALLDNIADIVSEAKRVASEDDGTAETAAVEGGTDALLDALGAEEPVLATDTAAQEVPLMDESGEGVDLAQMLANDEDGELLDIGDLLNSDEEGEALEEAQEAYDEAADSVAGGGAGLAATEEGSGATGATDVEEGAEDEEKQSIVQKILGAIKGMFKKKESDGEEDGEASEADEAEETDEAGGAEGEDGDDAEEEDPKEKKKREKEEAKKKKKEEADAKKKAKAEEKKKKDAEKKAKAAAKAAAPKKPKKKKKPDMSPTIPVPVLVVFLLLGVSLTASVNILGGVISYQTMVGNAKDAFAKQDYIEAYQLLVGQTDLEEADEKLREQAKLMAYMETKERQYQTFMASDTMNETGLANYSIRTSYQLALDSLISGVYYYNRNEGKANELGITEEYTNYGKTLVKELSDDFGMTTGEAVDLYRNSTRKEYTTQLQRILREKGLEETKK